jgi:hypothetical protein
MPKKYSKNYLWRMHVISVVVRFIMTVYAINKYQEQGDIKIHNEQILQPLYSVPVAMPFCTFLYNNNYYYY